MNLQIDKVSVIGLGYIGLPTAAIIASRGVDVVGVDVNPYAVDSINNQKAHIVEPDLDIMVQGAVSSRKLRAVMVPEPADVYIIAVPTPFKNGFKPDTSYVMDAVKAIAPTLKSGNLVIIESTSPVGTSERAAKMLSELRTDLVFPDGRSSGKKVDVSIAYCPERVLPGRILIELIENDRVIGGVTPECADHAEEFYKIFVHGNCIKTNSRTAELVKLTENSYRDVNIAFANEMSLICDSLDINVWELIELANRHPRVNILQPGPGVGGHCIAVDPWFIVDASPDYSKLIRTARNVNDGKPRYLVAKIKRMAEEYQSPRIACLGLAFKADIDDLRESPAVAITAELARIESSVVYAVEPHIEKLPLSLQEFENIKLSSVEDAIEDADIVVLLVNHKEFYEIDKSSLLEKYVVDTRGVWQLDQLDFYSRDRRKAFEKQVSDTLEVIQ